MREGFECARETPTRKGREGKGTFFGRVGFYVFYSGYVLLSLFFSMKILLFLKVTRAAFF